MHTYKHANSDNTIGKSVLTFFGNFVGKYYLRVLIESFTIN